MFNYLAFIHSGIEVATPGKAHEDGEELARDCAERLRQLDQERFPPKLFILLASPAYLESPSAQQLLNGVHEGLRRAGYPSRDLIGCSVAAVFFNREVYPKGALLICLASRLLAVEVAAASVVESTPQEAARNVLESLKLDSDAGNDPNPFANRTLFAFLPGIRPEGYIAAKLHESLRERLWARVPIIGGVSSGYVKGKGFSTGIQFAHGQANRNLVVAACVTSRTLWGISVSDNLEDTFDSIRIDQLGNDSRSVTMIDGKPAPDVIRALQEKYPFFALGKRNFNGEHVVELPIIVGDHQIKLLRKTSEGDSFTVLRDDRENNPNGVTGGITRSVRSIDLQNPVGCLGFKCSGYFSSQSTFGFDLSAEIIEVEETLGLEDNFVGGFVDGEAGRDTQGRSQIRTWSTAAIVFGDELRHRTTFQEAFERLADFLDQYPAPDQSLDGSVDALVKMIYSIGFPGVRLLLHLIDNTNTALVVPNANYTAGSLSPSEPNVFPLTIRLADENAFTEPAAIVARSKKQKFFSYKELNTVETSKYVLPLKNVKHTIIAVLEIDLGTVKKLNPFEEDLLTHLGVIAGASLTRVFNYQETTIRVKLQDVFTRCLDAPEIEEGVNQYLIGALDALSLRMGHIRLAHPDFKLTLYTGVGNYYQWAHKARGKIDFGENSPTAIAFSRRDGSLTIINDAPNDSAHLKLIEQLAGSSVESVKQVTALLRKIKSYANIRFEFGRQLPGGSDPTTAGMISLLSEDAWLFKYPQRKVLRTIAAHVESLFVHLTQKTFELIARRAKEEALLREEEAHREKEEANRHLEFRLKVIPTLAGHELDDFQTAMNKLLADFCVGVNASIGSIYLWDEDRSLYVLRAQYAWKQSDFVNKATYREDSGWFGARSLHDKPRHILDLFGHYWGEKNHRASKKISIPGGRYAEFMFGEPLTRANNVEVLGLPLAVGSRRLGVLALYRPIKPGAQSGFHPTVVALARSDSSRVALADAALRVAAVIDTLLSHQDDKVESAAQLRRKTISNQLSMHIENESESSFQSLICKSVVEVYGAVKADLHEVSWTTEDENPQVHWAESYSALDDQMNRSPAEPDRDLEEAVERYVRAYFDSDVVPDDIKVIPKRVDPEKRSDLDEAATERLVGRACLPVFLRAGRMWLVDLHWQTNEPRDYASEAHLRKKYLKQLSEDLSTFSRLWIQTRKRIEAEREAHSRRKNQQELLGKVGVMAQTGHDWKAGMRNLETLAKEIRDVVVDEKAREPVERLMRELSSLTNSVSTQLQLTDKTRLEPKTLPLRDFINDSRRESIRTQLRGNEPSIDVPSHLRVMAAQHATDVTFTNLIDNAVRIARASSEPMVSIVATADEQSKLVHIRFTNNGEQIKDSIRDAINNGKYYEFNGWGLVIAACFAEFGDGALRIEKPANGETVVILSLPAANKEIKDDRKNSRR